MQLLVVMNVERGRPDGPSSTRTSTAALERTATRNFWFCEPDSIVLSPVPIGADFAKFVGATLGFDITSVHIVFPCAGRSCAFDECLGSDEVIEGIRPLVRSFSEVTVLPCYYTPGVLAFCTKLGVDPPPGYVAAGQYGVDAFNRKTIFRLLASSINLPIPEGFVISSLPALEDTIRRMLDVTGAVIVKKDTGAAGAENVAVTIRDTGPLPGVRRTYCVQQGLDRIVSEVWSGLRDDSSYALVVEVFHAASHMLYFEYTIDERGVPVFSHSGEIQYEKGECNTLVYAGLRIPAQLPLHSMLVASAEATRLAYALAALGCRGIVNIDCILVNGELVLFNEFNNRWGGGSVLHNIASRLVGPHYINTRLVRSMRLLRTESFSDAVHSLQKTRLVFNRDAGEGVVPIAYSRDANSHNLECILIAASVTGMEALHRNVQAVFGR